MHSKLELNTERLRLSPFTKEATTALYPLNDDYDVLKYTGDAHFTYITTAEDFLNKYDQYQKYDVPIQS